jgi:hypothetical protein
MKNLILIYALIVFSFGCAAQSNVPSNAKDILISKNWILDRKEDHQYKIIFSTTKMTTYSEGVIIGEDEYYLSDDLSHCSTNGFIQANVGTSNIGKYIITKDFCLELMNVSNTKLEFNNLKLNTNMSATPE